MENPSIIRIALKTSNVNILKKFLNRLGRAKRAVEGGRNAAPDTKRTAVGVAAAEVARFLLQNIKIFLHFINKQYIFSSFYFHKQKCRTAVNRSASSNQLFTHA